MIHSDWHIHSEYSYDAAIPLESLAQNAMAQGLRAVGVTDHANYNDNSFLGDLHRSAAAVNALRKQYPILNLGVELTPIEKPEFDYVAKTGVRDGYVPPAQNEPYALALAASKEELMALGVRYAIGAAHWRVDVPHAKDLPDNLDASIKEWYRQQLWMACDERVTILGHPWYHGHGIWYDDFSIIPRAMNAEIAAALKENGKFVECNPHFYLSPRTSEKFRCQYAEFLRELFEMGIPVTYGSDAHQTYSDVRSAVEPYLAAVGFRDGDFSELSEKDLW